MAFISRYIGQYAVDYSKPPKYEDTHFSRKERRRIKKLEKEKEKALGKLGIKKPASNYHTLDGYTGGSLKGFAEVLDFEYGSKRIGGKVMKVAYCEVGKMQGLLSDN